MTDEQASLIAAAIALQRSPLEIVADPSRVDDLADSIATLARSLLFDLRDLTEKREQNDLLERLAMLSGRIDARR